MLSDRGVFDVTVDCYWCGVREKDDIRHVGVISGLGLLCLRCDGLDRPPSKPDNLDRCCGYLANLVFRKTFSGMDIVSNVAAYLAPSWIP